MAKMDVKTYVAQFNILGSGEDLHCENISHILYAALLNKFQITLTQEEYAYFKEYQERVFDLVENLRELTASTVPLVLDYLNKVNCYLVDIVIMLWCMPRTDNYLSKKIYSNKYKENIETYNIKIIKNIEHETIKNFCIETLSKTNNVPVHCIDYLWFYMNTISLEIVFYNSESAKYISFVMPEHSEYIEFGFNMEYMLEIGLGQIAYANDTTGKGSLRHFLQRFVTDIVIVDKLLQVGSNKAKNYRQQLTNISKDPSRYFGKELLSLPEEILDLLHKK